MEEFAIDGSVEQTVGGGVTVASPVVVESVVMLSAASAPPVIGSGLRVSVGNCRQRRTSYRVP
jgi:hypothetical protein